MHSWRLVGLFLHRFLENDLVSPHHDRRAVLSIAGGSVAAVSLFGGALSALVYQFDNNMPPGIYALKSIDDLFFFTGGSMLLLALVAVTQWDALALEPRDTAVLGPLPLPVAAIVRAKFIAVALLAIGVNLLWNFLPVLLRPFAIPIGLPITPIGMVRLTLAQAMATGAAGYFGFFTIVAIREGLTAVLGRQAFRRLSPALQALLLATAVGGMLLLPSQQSRVARTWLTDDAGPALLYPPLWFVGLSQTLAGPVIDDLPRVIPGQPWLVVPEHSATQWSRSLWPVYHDLARRAVVSLTLVAAMAIAACAWNNRRLPAVGAAVRACGPPSRHVRALAGVVAPLSLHQAGFWFAAQTLFRGSQHRSVLAGWSAVGAALAIVAARGGLRNDHDDVSTVPLALLAVQTFLLMALLAGVRHAAQLPADLRASPTFLLAWRGEAHRYISGATRCMWLATALPLLLALGVAHAVLLGVTAAVLHFAVGVAVSALLVETLFFRYPRLPFVSAYVPADEIKVRVLLGAGLALVIAFAIAALERLLLPTLPGCLLLIAVLFGASALLNHRGRAETLADGLFDEAGPEPPTQRLGLGATN